MKTTWFEEARFGLFVHFGLFSQLARGEWVMNKEELSRGELEQLAASFRSDAFDVDQIADLAVRAGMRYLVFTTMHHDGFRMYHSDWTSFCVTKTTAGRDFTAEVITAACRRGPLRRRRPARVLARTATGAAPRMRPSTSLVQNRGNAHSPRSSPALRSCSGRHCLVS